MLVIILLSVLFILSLLLNVFLVSKLNSAGEQLGGYDEFYDKTIADIDSVIQYLRNLMKRDLISSDPDVKNVHRAMVVVHDILVGYASLEKRKERKKG